MDQELEPKAAGTAGLAMRQNATDGHGSILVTART
jgi:hypothetical protein